ncbi:MAG: hypothetical protein V8R75_07790 [Oscillospiraceae bacterium]
MNRQFEYTSVMQDLHFTPHKGGDRGPGGGGGTGRASPEAAAHRPDCADRCMPDRGAGGERRGNRRFESAIDVFSPIFGGSSAAQTEIIDKKSAYPVGASDTDNGVPRSPPTP